MKKIILFLTLFLVTFVCKSQILSIENGVIFSHLNNNFNSKKTSYQINATLWYLESNWSFISSSLGYTGKGGDIQFMNPQNGSYIYYKDQNNYLSANTCFNLKLPLYAVDLYAGIGPRVDFRIKNSIPNHVNITNKVLFGLTIDTGIMFWKGRFGGGLKYSYLPTLTKFIKGDNYKDITMKFGVNLSYVL